MIFLDANTFYDYFDRKKLGLSMASDQKKDVKALTLFLNNRNDKALPESVFIEIVTHFRDDEKRLREILNFINNKNLKIYHNIRTWCINDDDIIMLLSHAYTLPLLGQLKLFAHMTVCILKIEIESTIAFCFEQINGILYVFYRTRELGFSTEDRTSAIAFMFLHYYQEQKDALLGEIRTELQTAYFNSGKSPERMLKDKYMDQLNEYCVVAEEIMAGIKKSNEGSSDNLLKIFQDAVAQAKEMGFTGGSDTMHAISDMVKTNPTFLRNVYISAEEAFKERGFSPTQSAYAVEVLFPAWLERGAMLKKNDLFDTLAVGTLDFVNMSVKKGSPIYDVPYLITYDKKMRNFISENYPYNEIITSKFDR